MAGSSRQVPGMLFEKTTGGIKSLVERGLVAAVGSQPRAPAAIYPPFCVRHLPFCAHALLFHLSRHHHDPITRTPR